MGKVSWETVLELANQTAKAVLASRFLQTGEIESKISDNIHSITLGLRQLGKKDLADKVEKEFVDFKKTASIHNSIQKKFNNEAHDSNFDEARGEFAGLLRSLEYRDRIIKIGLTEKEMTYLTLHDCDNLLSREIAEVHKTTQAAVDMVLNRARKKLQKSGLEIPIYRMSSETKRFLKSLGCTRK